MSAPRMPQPRELTYKEVLDLLRQLVDDLAMEAYDARMIVTEMDDDAPIDAYDLAELFEERGYLDLAERVLMGDL